MLRSALVSSTAKQLCRSGVVSVCLQLELYHQCSDQNNGVVCGPASGQNAYAGRKEVVESVSQECRPELGRYLLQADKQTKGLFPTPAAAHSAGLKIKKSFPVLQVAIYDNIQNTRTLVKLPAGSA
jgi:hypothetical protein